MRNHIRIGPVTLRIGSKLLASWGFPRVTIGGMSIWSRTNGGEVLLLAYHPRDCTTWHWSIGITRRQSACWTKANRERRARLYYEGNRHVPAPRWWHRFVNRDALRRNQWHDYYRLPFGYSIVVAQQDYHDQQKRQRHALREMTRLDEEYGLYDDEKVGDA